MTPEQQTQLGAKFWQYKTREASPHIAAPDCAAC